MKLITVFFILVMSVAAATRPRDSSRENASAHSAPSARMHYSYAGRDPDGWTNSVIDQGVAISSAPDYTTYIGSGIDYRVARIISDAAGNTYVAGSRLFFNVPASRWFNASLGDVFVTKLDPSGNVVFTATIGGKGSDEARGMALDPAGNIYVAGSTSSPNFPLRNALQSQPRGGTTGFLVKLSPDGSRLIYSTYFGGALGPSSVNALAADANGNVYLTGATNASDFPHTEGLPASRVSFGSISPTAGAFIAKVSPAGDKILYSGVIAGGAVACGAGSSCFLSARNTAGIGIALDAAGNAYIAGNTNTTDMPVTPGALRGQGIGAFVAKVNTSGSALVYLTYIGAANYVITPFANPGNIVNALTVDALGNAFIAGYTTDPKFPATPGAFQTTFSGPAEPAPYPPPPSDAFVAKLSPDGASMVWATYMGGTAADSAQAIALDSSGNAWVAGTTLSPEFPNSNGWSQGGDFLVELNPSGSALLYSARFPDGTAAQSVAVDPAGLVHIAGPYGIVSAFAPGQPPAMHIFGIANAAAGPISGRIAPGEVISIYGPRIGPSTPATFTLDSSGVIAKSLAGVQVFFEDSPAPLLYVSSDQVNAIVPFALAGKNSARVRLSFSGTTSPDFSAAVLPAVPEVFRNPDGSAAAVNQDGSLNSFGHPAKLGSVIAIWATGTGAVAATDGQIATSAQNFYCCGAQIESQPADVLYAGSAPGIVAGVTQINFRLPAQLYPGVKTVMVSITAGGRASAPVMVNVTE